MKILVACEFSGVVRDAFASMGHDAWSCDYLPSESPGKHYKGDVFDIINDGWDMMIAFPPCTYLSSVQTFLCRKDAQRTIKRVAAAKFFMDLYTCDIKQVCVENPTGVMTHIFRKSDQVVHPYFFGHARMKRTGLWLRGLPPLAHSKENYAEVPPPEKIWYQKSTGKIRYQRDANRLFTPGKERSRLSPYIAKAMAEQWG